MLTHADIRALEKRIAKLEELLANFAGMVVGSPGELQRVMNTIEVRRANDIHEPPVVIDDMKRLKAVRKLADMIIGGGQVAHSDVIKAVQGIVTARQFQAIVADLAGKGEIKIIKVPAGKGKPTTYYEYVDRRAQIA